MALKAESFPIIALIGNISNISQMIISLCLRNVQTDKGSELSKHLFLDCVSNSMFKCQEQT